jgi:hypothetical protein
LKTGGKGQRKRFTRQIKFGPFLHKKAPILSKKGAF